MNNFKEIICKLCQCPVEHGKYDIIDTVLKNIFTNIFPNLEINEETVICNVCLTKVLDSFKFKTLCLETEGILESYIKSEEMPPLDLTAVYQRKRKEHWNDIGDQNICRLCMQVVNTVCIPFGDAETEMVNLYISEVNLDITKDPVVCEGCLKSLIKHTSFIKSCLNIRVKVKVECDNSTEEKPHHFSESQIEQEGVEIKECSESENQIKTACEEEMVDIHQLHELQIKQESVIIKSEEESERESTGLEDVTHNAEQYDSEIPYAKKNEDLYQVLNDSTEVIHKDDFQAQKYPTDTSGFEEHKPKTLKCDKCPYQTKYKSNLKMHNLKHMDPSLVEVHECDKCSYKSFFKCNLNKHKLKHVDLADIEMFRCYRCPYQTKYKSDLTKHQLIHIDPSQIQMFDCDKCPYRAKFKSTLKQHKLKHADPSRAVVAEMHECDKCSYKSFNKWRLNRHKLTHTDPSNIEMFKCNQCCYQTKFKSHLKKHQVIHSDPSQREVFKCDKCSYQVFYLKNLKHHKLKHESEKKLRKICVVINEIIKADGTLQNI